MKNLLELKRFQIKGSRVNQIYPLTEHSGAFRVYIGGRSFDVIASVDEGGSLDDILHMLCGGMDAIVTQFCAEDGDAQMRKDMLRSVAMEILSLADAGGAIHDAVMIKIPRRGENNG